MSLRPAILGAAIVSGLVLAAASGGHGLPGGGIGYVSSVSGLKPPVLGVLVTVLGGDDRLQLVNYSGETIVVDGYEGEPFLRFDHHGVYENVLSPATFLSRVRDPAAIQVPSSADPSSRPRWRKVSEGTTFAWHDKRIHWTRPELPEVIQRAPREIHLIFHWRIPAEAGERRFFITGFLGYRPPPRPGDGTNWWLLGGAVGGAALAAVAIGAGARRLRRRAL